MVLGPADLAATVDVDLDEPHVAHPLEMRTYGVGVEPEMVGDLSRGDGPAALTEVPVDRVPGVVGQCFQHVERPWGRVCRRNHSHVAQASPFHDITRRVPVK